MGRAALSEQRMENRARTLRRSIERAETKAAEANQAAEDARADLEAIWRAECDRFGREVPTDALILDVLALVDVEDGDVWRWKGMYNNQSLPIVRIAKRERGRLVENSEASVVRLLAIAFGVIGRDEFGMLFPDGDRDDVNPWHRTLRATDRPMGYRGRYEFDKRSA